MVQQYSSLEMIMQISGLYVNVFYYNKVMLGRTHPLLIDITFMNFTYKREPNQQQVGYATNG